MTEDSLELAEALITKRVAPFDLGKFEDGYELAVKELVNAKVNHLPVPKDEMPVVRSGNVANLMDALRKSIGEAKPAKKPVGSVKAVPQKGIQLVKPVKAQAKRKSA